MTPHRRYIRSKETQRATVRKCNLAGSQGKTSRVEFIGCALNMFIPSKQPLLNKNKKQIQSLKNI